jgi:hypothetical protein
MKGEQLSIDFEQQQPPAQVAVERVRPEGIPEDAWVAIEAMRARAAEREPFSIGGRQISREQLQAEADAVAIRQMARGRR